MVVPNYILNLLSSLKCCLICSIFEVPTSTYFILKFIYTTLYIRYISSMLVMCNGGDQRTTNYISQSTRNFSINNNWAVTERHHVIVMLLPCATA